MQSYNPADVTPSLLSKKEYCINLFKDYLIHDEYPLKINLPRDLVFELLGNSCVNDDKKGIIDVTWYYNECYQHHPFSLVNIEIKQKNYIEEYNKWRSCILPKINDTTELPGNFTNFKDILNYAALNKQTVVIGESHNHSTPKAILMHNIEFLKQQNAAIFIEGVRVELQDELNKSISQRKPTPLVEVYLSNESRNQPSSYYTQENLIRTCIVEGIPVIGCEGNCKLMA